jgi:hypothetical protein
VVGDGEGEKESVGIAWQVMIFFSFAPKIWLFILLVELLHTISATIVVVC